MVDLSARVRRRNLFDSAQEQSTAFVNRHSECSQEKEGRKKKKLGNTQKKGQNSAFLNTEHKEQFLRCPVCFIQSVTPSLRAFRALRQRCRCSALNIYRRGQMGVGFTRASAGVQKIAQQPPADWKLLKSITATGGPCQRGARRAAMLLLGVPRKALITLIRRRSYAGPRMFTHNSALALSSVYAGTLRFKPHKSGSQAALR